MSDDKLNALFAAHDKSINQIKKMDERIDNLSPYEIAKLEYLYNQAERQAWRVAGHFKKLHKYHEGMAEISQGEEYKRVASDSRAVDAQYLSRIAKGEQLVFAAEFEGEYITWRGIATTYERAANSLKDMIKAVTVESGNQSA